MRSLVIVKTYFFTIPTTQTPLLTIPPLRRAPRNTPRPWGRPLLYCKEAWGVRVREAPPVTKGDNKGVYFLFDHRKVCLDQSLKEIALEYYLMYVFQV